MLYENNKAYGDIVNGAPVPFLPLYAAQNGQRLNDRKSKSVRLSGIYYKLSKELDGSAAEAMKKRAGRVYGCCITRELAINPDTGYAYNTFSKRCRDRNCPECARVRSFSLQNKIRDITPALIAQSNADDALIFGTLTIKNPLIKDLKLCLKVMSKAFARMLARKDFKRVAVGGFRCFEVTRGETGSEFCHPHIHFLLQVKKEYFPFTSPLYIKNDTWSEAWTDCLDLEFKKHNEEEEKKYIKSIKKEQIKDKGNLEDFIKKTKEENKKEYVKNTFNFNRSDYPNGRAFVKILRVQTPESARKKLKNPVYASIGTLQKEGDQVINYILKYTNNEDFDSKKSLVKNDQFFAEYDRQIKGIRAIAFFGIYKKLISEIEEKEYIEEDFKKEIEKNGKNEFYTAIYDDDHSYILIKTTEAEVLEKKRFNMVKSAFNTLKVQLEIKTKCLLNIHTTYYNNRFLIVDTLESKETDKYLETISKQLNNNIFEKLNEEDKKEYVEKYSFNLRPLSFEDKMKINDEILNINEVSLRIYNTFKRLEKLGEVVEGLNGFEQPFYSYNFESKFFEVIPNFLEEEIKAIRERYLKVIEMVETDPPF